MLQKSNNNNRQVQRTKSWIFEALMLLMDEKPYDKITVSDIAEKAGVARPTFYRNYNDKDEVVFQYIDYSFSTELIYAENDIKDDKHNNIVLIFDYNYMVKHQKNIKRIISTASIENRIYRELQKYTLSLAERYKEQLSAEEYLICRYKICYQMIGSLRIIFDWFVNDMPMPVTDIVLMLNAMNIPKTVQFRNIPGIVVRLKEGESYGKK
ncbi:MAG: TetR/AcrR family transcriptional regulator [Treponema sp.]|nr:TetR/AcrR family transcriptional regulator [Treponema sp.]